ncbi:hypothetical protein [Archangium violaceum]|uniref:hypothetical protein n=1 Tax=Archangium violaceum TaxID=83451 RepID=UPI0036DB016A
MTWADTGVDERMAPGLASTLAQAHLPGWNAPTQFIKVEMAESSYPNGYFTCRYVLVRGETL